MPQKQKRGICLIVISVDNIVISAFLGLVAVAAYGNYYYVVTTVTGLVSVIYNSVTGGFGNKVYTETKAENFKLFMKMSWLSQLAVLWCAAMMISIYQPFVVLWTKGNPDLVRHSLTPVIMVVFFYVNQSRHMMLSFKSAAGIWRQDRWKPIVAGALNISLNILMVLFLPDAYKLDGVISSTLIAYIVVEIPWETRAVFTSFFNKADARQYGRFHLRFATIALFVCTATWWIVSCIHLSGWLGLAAQGTIAAIVSSSLILAVFRNEAIHAIRNLLDKRSPR